MLLDAVGQQLTSKLPRSWAVSINREPRRPADDGTDGVLTVTSADHLSGSMAVYVKARLEPRNVPMLANIQTTSEMPLLAVAPWLSPRTRDLLTTHGISHLDLTGNTHLQLERPAVYLATTGAPHDPNPLPRRELSLASTAAARLTRLLLDVAPPYTPTDLSKDLVPTGDAADVLAQHSGVSLPHVSRLLTQLDREALVDRGHRGIVTGVDWRALLRLRAQNYDLFKSHTVHRFIAPRGAREAQRDLARSPAGTYRALTGAFAAETLHETVASPTQLIVYADDPQHTAKALNLMPADENPDVLLLTDFDYSTVDRVIRGPGVTTVAVSQIALDCLAGNGRLPAEGEALLSWMAEESRWRRRTLTGLGLRAPVYP